MNAMDKFTVVGMAKMTDVGQVWPVNAGNLFDSAAEALASASRRSRPYTLSVARVVPTLKVGEFIIAEFC